MRLIALRDGNLHGRSSFILRLLYGPLHPQRLRPLGWLSTSSRCWRSSGSTQSHRVRARWRKPLRLHVSSDGKHLFCISLRIAHVLLRPHNPLVDLFTKSQIRVGRSHGVIGVFFGSNEAITFSRAHNSIGVKMTEIQPNASKVIHNKDPIASVAQSCLLCGAFLALQGKGFKNVK